MERPTATNAARAARIPGGAPPGGALPRGTRAALLLLCGVLLAAAALILGTTLVAERMGDRKGLQRLERHLEAGVELLAEEARRHGRAAAVGHALHGDADPGAFREALTRAHGLLFVAQLDAEGVLLGVATPPGHRLAMPEIVLAELLAHLPPPRGDEVAAVLAPWLGRPHLVFEAPLGGGGGLQGRLVGLRAADPGYFVRLIGDLTVGSLRFAPPEETGPGELARPVRLGDGPVAGHLLFTPQLPGRDIVRGTALPVVGGAVAVLVGLGLWLVRRVGEVARAGAAREAQARFLALHDELTGLPNRRAFQAGLAAMLGGAGGAGDAAGGADADDAGDAAGGADAGDAGGPAGGAAPVAVALLDLDHFKRVNDTLGHAAGDAMIRVAAARLRARLPPAALVARLGGDEFAVALPLAGAAGAAGAAGDGAAAGDGLAPLRAARAACDEPYGLGRDGRVAHGSASMGVALAPAHGRDGAELLRRADIALYQAKAEGRGRLALFEEGADARLRERIALEAELRAAVAAGRLELHYQPVVDAASGAAVGVEALVRWRQPGRGLVPPGQFLPLAEETGLILPLGAWVVRRAMLDQRRLPPGLKVAVNASPAQLRDPGLVPLLRAALAETGADPRAIEIEVTESVFLDDDAGTRARLRELRGLGFSVALDDFGTGFSSLGYLRRFAFDRLKIDRGFVAGLEAGGEARAIVEAIVRLARALGMATTAEGVETAAAAAALAGLGCTHLQGWHFGQPEPVEALLARLAPPPAPPAREPLAA